MKKNCCEPNNKKSGVKKLDPFIIGAVLITLVLFAGVIWYGTKTGESVQVETSEQVVISTDEKKYDWGTIDINSGIVNKTFTIENKGTGVLKLYDVETSCMCTTAQLITKDKTSKKFGMHDPSYSVFDVQPGESAELLVEFDPIFHGPSGVGDISRTITIKTNDKNNSELSFNLTAKVIKE